MDTRVSIFKCYNVQEVKANIATYLERFAGLLPQASDARILIKPNLNSNMNALTGNTTDLRVLAAIVEFLKDRGYSNITIGEGTNSGFYRENINVISRLRVDRLAKYYGVDVIDFNHAPSRPIELEGGIIAEAAEQCLDADFFINVPKIKMHYETEMTACLKSLIGCLVGRENKKKVHSSLADNILKLNEHIHPHLYVVDGLIAMEGTGPSLGTPKKIDTVLIGTNPFLLDMVISRIMGFESWKEIPVLQLASAKGGITDELVETFEGIELCKHIHAFKRPEYSWLVALVINPRVQKYLIKIRYAPLVKRLFGLQIVKKLLFRTGISQDYIIYDDGDFSVPRVSVGRCVEGCSVCADLCPLGKDLPGAFKTAEDMKDCIKCLYCFAVCPNQAIGVDGDLGFFNQQIRQYDTQIREMFAR